MRDYLIFPPSIAVLMHHEALRNYINILTKLNYEIKDFLNNVKDFIMEEVVIMDKLLQSIGISDAVLSNTIRDLTDGRLSEEYDSLRALFNKYQNNPEVEFLVTNITATIQLCDRLATTIGREAGRLKLLRRLEYEFVRYCLGIGDRGINEYLAEVGTKAIRELRSIMYRSKVLGRYL